MNLQKAIKARFINYKATHFDRFPEGRLLRALKGIHNNKRCFIIGNGPSLAIHDLDILLKRKEISFAFNRIYHIFDQTSWRPTYYISQDQKMLSGCYRDVERRVTGKKFIPAEMKWYDGINMSGVNYFHIINSNKDNKPLFSDNIAKYVVNSKTVVFTAIQFAVYMGMKEIYLMGVDHHFHTSINSQGEIVVDPTAKDYFSDDYNRDRENLYIPNTDLSTLTYVAAKEYADTHGIEIYNATRGGKLEVFPRVDFDSLF
jgi:hypothetical protein